MTGPEESTAAEPAQRGHRTQAERREHTRALLLDATIDTLVELGYARASVTEICRRAGVSRGAQQHHFSTKADLMAQAVEHLVEKLRQETLGSLRELPTGAELIGAEIDQLWAVYSGKLSNAVLELWVAARTDPELKAAMLPVDRALGRSALELFRKVAPGDTPEELTESLFWLTVNLTRGLALDAEIGGGADRHRALLDHWKRIVTEQYLRHANP